MTEDERLDIQWLCERLKSDAYYDKITADLQCLQAILCGISSDGTITTEEVQGLSRWLEEHKHLRTCWPYDELDTLVTVALQDQRVDEEEQRILAGFFNEFINLRCEPKSIQSPFMFEAGTVQAVCAVCPEITFSGSVFCFTGESCRCSRRQLTELVGKFGGKTIINVNRTLNYLVIGGAGNPCWAYACYGRKVEAAIALRKKGAKLLLVHENDFFDAASDLGMR